MRVTYRYVDNKAYWEKRWGDITADMPMENLNVYPLKYAQKIVKDSAGKILEAGCGAGRIVRYYHNLNYDILGFDFIEVAINKLKKVDPSLNVEVGNILNLRFADCSFKYILAFGLYHNLESGLKEAIAETYRVMENGGSICASFRADNIQTKLTDFLTKVKSGIDSSSFKAREFHKMNLTKHELQKLFEDAGFHIHSIEPVENMPILYKFALFRSGKHKKFNENLGRIEGYQLSWVGIKLQNMLMRYFPDQFCNIYVLIANKNE